MRLQIDEISKKLRKREKKNAQTIYSISTEIMLNWSIGIGRNSNGTETGNKKQRKQNYS